MPRHARALLLLLLALAPLLALPARAARPAAAPIGPGDVYLALGDSLPAGFEVADDGQPGFPTPLHAALRARRPGIALVNMGQATGTGVEGGETSTTFLAPGGQLERAVAFIAAERAAGRVVSPVTLSIGGNDAVGVILPGSTTTVTAALALYRANLSEALDRLLGVLTEGGARTGDLIVQNYYNPYPGLASTPPYNLLLGSVNPDSDLPRFNQIIAEEAAARGVPVADVYTPFLGREAQYLYVQRPYPSNPFGLTPDQLRASFDFHPRPAGHQAIAAAFLAAGGYTTTIYLPALVR